MIELQDFRKAMSRLGAAVNVITTDGPAGRFGMTATAVCSVSDDPATLLLCVNRTARINPILKENGRFAVNVLAGHQDDVSNSFSDKALSMDMRFERHGPWVSLPGDPPGLRGALAVLTCDLASVTEVGTHTLFIGTVDRLLMGEQAPGLVYFDRAYHQLPAGA